MTDISHFEVVKGSDTHEESLAQEFLKPAEVELSSETEDEIVLPIYFSFVNSVLVNYIVLRCCKISNAKFKLLAMQCNY